MSALTDIQRALNIIRKVVDAQHKNIGLDALVLLNQTAASVSTLLKDKPSTSNKLERPTPLPIPKPISLQLSHRLHQVISHLR